VNCTCNREKGLELGKEGGYERKPQYRLIIRIQEEKRPNPVRNALSARARVGGAKQMSWLVILFSKGKRKGVFISAHDSQQKLLTWLNIFKRTTIERYKGNCDRRKDLKKKKKHQVKAPEEEGR